MKKKIIVFISVVLISPYLLLSQEYASPVDINILLSGTFGELRNNHFHSGIDIKTKGVKGHKIRAIYEGYISRIKVSTWGYGKTIYVTHPETGHTSVYAHLHKFSSKIDSIVIKKHYSKKSFELDFSISKDLIKVKKNEIIGYSGNSGGSAGPHLHFEIRETKSQKPINPLKFNFEIFDNISPTLKKLKIYAFDTTLINGYNSSKIYNLTNEENYYNINEIPEISGPFAFGIFTYDKSNGSNNKNGVYNIKVTIDSINYYEFKTDTLDFNTSRFINAHIDFYEKYHNKTKYHKCYKLENNKLDIYPSIINKGIIKFDQNKHYNVTISVSDFFKNTSYLKFKIKVNNQPLLFKCKNNNDKKNTLFRSNKSNIYKSENIEIHMKPFTIYEDIFLEYSKIKTNKETFGPIHIVHKADVPVHKKYIISIKTKVPDSLKNKTFIATIDTKGNYKFIGGTWKNDYLRAQCREFGKFCIIADTTKPDIEAINIFNGKELKQQNNIQFKIKDNLSGIKTFEGKINEKWILLDYDHKSNILKYNYNKNFQKGKKELTITVIDNVNNKTTYSAELIF